MRKITIEVVLLQRVEHLDQHQKDKLASLTNARGEVEAREEQNVCLMCPCCGHIFYVPLGMFESGVIPPCPYCGITGFI